MNAHELATELEACFTKADWNVLEAATVLRQQAEKIADLQTTVSFLEDECKSLRGQVNEAA